MTVESSRPKHDYLGYRIVDFAMQRALRLLPASPWAEKWALWWGYRFRPAPSVVSLRSGPLINITHADHLQLLLYYLGTFEPYCLPYLHACAKPGSTVLDVGANIGFYTLESAAAVGATGRVLSIEAAPTHLTALNHNVAMNKLQNVSVIGCAVGDAPGRAVLTRPRGDNLGMFTLGAVEGDEGYDVEISTIDALLDAQGIQSLDLVKMDIEGSEFRALRGAARTLERFRPAILIELNDVALRRCGSSPQAVNALLREIGYRGWRITRHSVEMVTDNVNGDCDECIYIHQSDRARMERAGLPL